MVGISDKMGGARAMSRCEMLKVQPYSDSDEHLFRSYLSDGYMATLETVAGWMREAGLTPRTDAAGNLVGRYEAYDPPLISGEGGVSSSDGATGGVNPPPPNMAVSPLKSGGSQKPKALLIASHLDSVRDGGAFDGPLGVMLGIEVVAALNAAGRRLPFAIEIYGFGDEEGSRFPKPMLTSRAVAGTLEAEELSVADREGAPLAGVLTSRDLKVTDYLKSKRDPSEFIGYFEAHIEQGPVLEAENLPLGVVTAIAAQTRFEARVTGVAGHAGTTSMGLRSDALTAAAEMVLAIEAIAGEGPDGLVATVGRMTVSPGAVNVVPGEVVFSIDVRAGLAAVRDAAAARIVAAIEAIAARRKVGLELRKTHELPESPCDAGLMAHLEAALTACGLPIRRMVSGAGHDAMIFAPLMPTAMLFVRCEGGISHNPLENITPEDADAAFKVMLAFIDQLETAYVPAI